MTKVHIVGGDNLIERMFKKQVGFEVTSKAADADLLVFTGGEDVSPNLYGEKRLVQTRANPERDNREIAVFKEFKDKPKVGICRGGQFLNVMSGGKMYQDVDNHCRTHSLYSADKNEYLGEVTSTHHQMIRPKAGALLIAYACESTVRVRESGTFVGNFTDDSEIVFYSETKSLCFQPHPEYEGDTETKVIFFDTLKAIFPHLNQEWAS